MVMVEQEHLGSERVKGRERVGRNFVGLEPECKRLENRLAKSTVRDR